MATSMTLAFDILARDKTAKAFNSAGKNAETMTSKVTSAAKLAITGLAAAGAGQFLKGTTSAAAEANRVSAQTQAVLKSTGSTAGVTEGQIGKLANQLKHMSGVSDETIQSGQNMLLTFTNVRNEVGKGNNIFDQATKTMLDMSVALGQDTKSSAIQLGKALNDPIRGVTALRRVGVQFTKAQEAQIKKLVETGDVMGAQKLILAELGKEFGGSAKAAGDALTPMQKLAIHMGDFQETIGLKLLPVIETLTGFLAKHPGLILPLAAVIGGVLVAAFSAWAISATSAAVATLAATAPVIAAAAPFVALGAAVAALAVIVVKNWDTIKNAVGTAVSAVSGFIGSLIERFGSMGSGIVGALTGVAKLITTPYRVAFNAIARLWNNTVGKLSFKIPGWVPGIGGKGFDVPNIPTFHTGGPITADLPRFPGDGPNERTIRAQIGETVHTRGAGGVQFGDINVDARGVGDSPAVGEFVSRFVGWRLGLAGGL